MEHLGIDDPTVDVRISTFTGESFQLVGVHPAPLFHHPVHGAVGSGGGGLFGRIYVEYLAPAHRLRPTRFA